MITYKKFKQLGIDLFEPGFENYPYFCTPKGATIFGWEGIDGIHYCFIRGFSETVFAVSPSNTPGDYVHPVAADFADFLGLILSCKGTAAIEQAHGWPRSVFDDFVATSEPDSHYDAVLKIAEKFSVEPITDPYDYIKKLQASFDYKKIKFEPDYYETVPDEILPEKFEWKVYFDEGFWKHRSRSRAGQEYPLNVDSVDHALDRFTYLYERYLTDSDVYVAVVPDKGQYLAEKSGHLALHFGKLNSILLDRMPFATPIDLYSHLDAQDFYRTDIHWRQENLIPAAQAICQALNISVPRQEDFTVTSLDRPFYGVYYGQAALPMEPDTMCLLESALLKNCQVYDYETGQYSGIYDLEKLDSRDLYDVFLSGPRSLLTIENPAAETDRELILFRDSFGSSMAPLLVQGYQKITLVDIRYLSSAMLDRFIDFHGQDVLFLYSTLVLNNSNQLQ